MDEIDQELFRVLRITVIFYGFILLLIWIYSQITNSWGTIWLRNLMFLLTILLIFSASTKYIIENKTLRKTINVSQKYLEKNPKLLKFVQAVLAYFKIKKKFRKYYLIIIFFTLLIIIIWLIINSYIS